MNRITIMGHLGADAVLKEVHGTPVMEIRVATKGKAGSEDTTIWYHCSGWGERWEKIAPYLTKGLLILVEGDLGAPRAFVDKNGLPKSNPEVKISLVRFIPGQKPADQPQETSTPPPQPSRDDFDNTGCPF